MSAFLSVQKHHLTSQEREAPKIIYYNRDSHMLASRMQEEIMKIRGFLHKVMWNLCEKVHSKQAGNIGKFNADKEDWVSYTNCLSQYFTANGIAEDAAEKKGNPPLRVWCIYI